MRLGVARKRHERKREKNINVIVNAVNTLIASTLFSAQKILIPIQVNKRKRNTRGGESVREMFFIPSSCHMAIKVISGNRKDIILGEYMPTIAVNKAKEKSAPFSYVCMLFNLTLLFHYIRKLYNMISVCKRIKRFLSDRGEIRARISSSTWYPSRISRSRIL